jgi:membrane protein required for colicin V production
MNYFDFTIMVIVFIFIVMGFRKGLVAEVLGLIGILVAIVMAVRFGPEAARLIPERFQVPQIIAVFAGFAAVFGGIMALFHLLTKGMQKTMHPTALKWLDKMGGVLIGAVEGTFIASVLIFVFSLTPLAVAVEEDIDRSLLYRATGRVAPSVLQVAYEMVPVGKTFDEIKSNILGKLESVEAKKVVEEVTEQAQTTTQPRRSNRSNRSTSSGGGERGRR